MRRLDQDQAVWIEAERAQTMTIRTAVIAQPVRRQDEQERVRLRHAGKERHDETEGSRGGACLGHEFMPDRRRRGRLAAGNGRWRKAEGNSFCGPKILDFRQ